jgi:hypothetical protein
LGRWVCWALTNDKPKGSAKAVKAIKVGPRKRT